MCSLTHAHRRGWLCSVMQTVEILRYCAFLTLEKSGQLTPRYDAHRRVSDAHCRDWLRGGTHTTEIVKAVWYTPQRFFSIFEHLPLWYDANLAVCITLLRLTAWWRRLNPRWDVHCTLWSFLKIWISRRYRKKNSKILWPAYQWPRWVRTMKKNW